MEVDGLTLHYVDEGPRDAKDTIVFFHGNPTWSLLYRGIIPRLSDSIRCICFDHPGYGFSERPDKKDYDYKPETHSALMTKAIDKLGLKSFGVFVQDWGGPIGLGVAGRNPDAITHIILGDTFAFPITDIPEHKSAYRFSKTMGGDDNLENIIKNNAFINTAVALLIQGQFKRDKSFCNELREAYTAPFAKEEWRYPTWISPHEIAEGVEYLTEVESNMEKLRDKPALIFWGENDPVLSAQLRPWFEERLPKHKSISLPNASHFFQEDEPELVAKEVREFVGV